GPHPDGTLMVGRIAHGLVALVAPFVERILRRERAQSARGEQVTPDGVQYGELHGLVGNFVVERTGDDLVGAYEGIARAVRRRIVGEVTPFGIPERREERSAYGVGQLPPCPDEIPVAERFGQFQRIAYGVVPKCVDFDLVSLPARDRPAVHHGVHPGHGQRRVGGPYEAVAVYADHLADTPPVGFEYLLHRCSVASPYLFAGGV